MIVTKYLDNTVFDYKYPYVETPAFVAWAIRDFYQCNIDATSGQSVFGRYMIFNFELFVDWRVIITKKKRQVDMITMLGKSRVTKKLAIYYMWK